MIQYVKLPSEYIREFSLDLLQGKRNTRKFPDGMLSVFQTLLYLKMKNPSAYQSILGVLALNGYLYFTRQDPEFLFANGQFDGNPETVQFSKQLRACKNISDIERQIHKEPGFLLNLIDIAEIQKRNYSSVESIYYDAIEKFYPEILANFCPYHRVESALRGLRKEDSKIDQMERKIYDYYLKQCQSEESLCALMDTTIFFHKQYQRDDRITFLNRVLETYYYYKKGIECISSDLLVGKERNLNRQIEEMGPEQVIEQSDVDLDLLFNLFDGYFEYHNKVTDEIQGDIAKVSKEKQYMKLFSKQEK